MPISRAQLAKELEPGLNALFGMEFARYENEHAEIFDTETSDRAFEEEVMLSGFGTAPTKFEGSAVNFDTANESFTARYTHETIALAFSITEEAIEDNLYDRLGARYTRALARSMAHTKQVKAASILNNAFTAGAFAGGDGVALCDASHPLTSGGTFNNADGNVCIGYQAGNGVDGGDNNICIGYQAGYLLDSESETIAMGYQTLRNVGNSYSVGIGSQAGRFQTNGPNTLLGGFAGMGVSGNSLARYNTILGYKSGYVLEEGYYNIIVGGNDVGLSVKDGYHNVIIGGEDTGYNLTDGTGNIILGSQAGKSIVTGNYNIIIGHSSSLSSDTSNQLFIGSGSVATISASLTTGDILLQGDVSSSATSTASFGTYIGDGSQLSGISGGSGFPYVGDAVITGSLVVSSSNSTASLTLEGSGSTVFEVLGSAGTLFSVDDSLTGTLFSANDVSGLPVLQAESDGEVYLGKSPQSLYTTAVISATSASSTASVAALSTSSYDGAFFDYTITSASNARAGSIMSVWNGGNITFTETTTTDIGSTTGLDFQVIISASQAQLVSITDSTSPNIYKVKTIIRAI